MSKEIAEEISDPIELEVWDFLVDKITTNTQKLQSLQFNKFKLRLNMTTSQTKGIPDNNLNNKNALLKQANHLIELEEDLTNAHVQVMDEIDSLRTANANKPRIEIMLDSATTSFNKLLAYSVFHGPTGQQIQKEVIKLPADKISKPESKPDLGDMEFR